MKDVTMDCRHCRERLIDLLEDNFASGEASTQAAMRAHLQNCPDCQREYEFLSAIRHDLRSFQEVTVPADLRQRVRSQLISETKNTKVQKSFFALQPARFTLSSGAVLAAFCLLLIVRGHNDVTVPDIYDPNSAPPTKQNFEVPDSAFPTPSVKTKPSPKSTIKTGPKKQSPQNVSRESTPPVSMSAEKSSDSASWPEANNSSASNKSSRRTTSVSPVFPPTNKLTRNKQTVLPNLSQVWKSGQQNLPVVPQMRAPLHDTPEGAISAPGNEAPQTHSAPPAPAISLPDGDHKDIPNGRTGMRASNPRMNAAMGTMHRSGTSASTAKSNNLDSGTALSLAIPSLNGAQGPTGAQGPQGPAGAMATNENSVHLAPQNEAVAPLSAFPNRTHNGFAFNSTRIMAVRKPDFTLPLNTTQTFNLVLTPRQDYQLAQVRLTLSDGLKFADEINEANNEAVEKPEAPSTPDGKSNVVKKIEPSRIIWRGAVQKGVPIENAIELKAATAGLKNSTLTLEGIDGQKLQTQIVTFQAQEPQAEGKTPAPPVDDK